MSSLGNDPRFLTIIVGSPYINPRTISIKLNDRDERNAVLNGIRQMVNTLLKDASLSPGKSSHKKIATNISDNQKSDEIINGVNPLINLQSETKPIPASNNPLFISTIESRRKVLIYNDNNYYDFIFSLILYFH